MKQFRIGRAITRYKKSDASLAKSAGLTDISIKEAMPIAYAHGLEPRYDKSLVESKITAVSDSGPLMVLAKPEGQKVEFKLLWCKGKLFRK